MGATGTATSGVGNMDSVPVVSNDRIMTGTATVRKVGIHKGGMHAAGQAVTGVANMSTLPTSDSPNVVTGSTKKVGVRKSGESAVSGTKGIDYDDLGPGVRVANGLV